MAILQDLLSAADFKGQLLNKRACLWARGHEDIDALPKTIPVNLTALVMLKTD